MNQYVFIDFTLYTSHRYKPTTHIMVQVLHSKEEFDKAVGFFPTVDNTVVSS